MVDLTVKKRCYSVVLVTYGEVEELTPRSLWPSSRKIVQVVTRQIVKLPKFMIYALGDFRSTKHYIDWKINRYRSRLVPINRAQAKGVALELKRDQRLAEAGVSVEVVEAYYFVPPYLEDVLQKFRDRSDGVIVVPMIPVESAFSCGPACHVAIDIYGEGHLAFLRVVRGLWKDADLHSLYLDYVFASLAAGIGSKEGRRTGLVLVIHGTIVKNRKGNTPSVFTGLNETMEFFRLMREKILADPRNVFGEVKLGCLNHSTGGEWTPETVQLALEELQQDGFDAVAMFPFGYFADNSETDYEAKKLLDGSAIPIKQYIPCINESPGFARWLSSKIAGEIGLLELQRKVFGTDESMAHTNTQTP
ncbi:MAG: ferrochelatase [Chlorobiaceae bacterium]|nr:ferrochelatase [Chlorobiaceae bacterium]